MRDNPARGRIFLMFYGARGDVAQPTKSTRV